MSVLDQFRLDGRVALVTGGSRGLGKAMAEALASAGASVAVSARTLEASEPAAKSIAESTGSKTLALAAEITHWDDVEAMVARTVAEFGKIDILVNNAGINIRGPIEDLAEDDFDRVIAANLKGPWLTSRAVAKLMKQQKYGRVINVSSILGEVSMPLRTPYASSKGGLTLMTKTLALEWAPFNITVNALCPGPFATEMNLPLLNDPKAKADMTSKVPLGRWADPSELGPAAVFLASAGFQLRDRHLPLRRRRIHGPMRFAMSDYRRSPKGFRASGVKAGIKPSGTLDLALIVAEADCAAAGTFTTNRVAAAPVQWGRSIVPSDEVRAIVINAGNANAATGQQGLDNTRTMAERVAQHVGCEPHGVLVASTGVIGHQLPMDRVLDGIDAAYEALSEAEDGFRDASLSILTTDTHPKVVSRAVTLSTGRHSLLGMAKGAAMIGPNMATMLGFLLTDARVAPGALQGILAEAVEDSFNCVSVEGHMSTNDTVLMLSAGDSTQPLLKGGDLKLFAEGVREACIELARMIPGDGEGATHRITIDVQGCVDREEATKIAKAVANSPLVKTAIHGADPNWGRIVSAAGYAGVPFAESELSLRLNGVPLYAEGVPLPFDAESVSNDLRDQRETQILLTLKRGDAAIRFWTCDLTAEYVRLNADYTT